MNDVFFRLPPVNGNEIGGAQWADTAGILLVGVVAIAIESRAVADVFGTYPPIPVADHVRVSGSEGVEHVALGHLRRCRGVFKQFKHQKFRPSSPHRWQGMGYPGCSWHSVG